MFCFCFVTRPNVAFGLIDLDSAIEKQWLGLSIKNDSSQQINAAFLNSMAAGWMKTFRYLLTFDRVQLLFPMSVLFQNIYNNSNRVTPNLKQKYYSIIIYC